MRRARDGNPRVSTASLDRPPARPPVTRSKMKGSDNQEKLVYQIIEDAANKGGAAPRRRAS